MRFSKKSWNGTDTAPSESDPLLPPNESAPEISGQGYFHQKTRHGKEPQSHIIEDTRDPKEDFEDVRDPIVVASPLRVLVLLFLCVVGLGLLISFLSSNGFHERQKAPLVPETPRGNLRQQVDQILSENPLFGSDLLTCKRKSTDRSVDGHNDLAFIIHIINNNRIYDPEFTKPFEDGGYKAHVDLPRLKAGKVGGTFWSAFIPCPTKGTDFSDETYGEVVSMTFSQIDLLRRLFSAYPQVFSSPYQNSSSAAHAFDHDHLLSSPIGIEGLHQIGNAFSNLRNYYSLGVRYATLTHNCHNAFADAAMVINASGQMVANQPHWGGVSEAGRTLIKEMNRLGMLVDLSHVSKDTMLDVLGGRPEKWVGSRAPVIFSHSSAFALCPHPRNVPDDVLELVKKTNSLVMVNFAPDFISCIPSDASSGLPDFYPPNSTLHQVARHIKYIGDTIGFNHVGLGSDFDGIPSTPEGLEDVSKYPDLVYELLTLGVTVDDATKLVGRNVLRVWKDADAMSLQMQKEGVLPAEDILKPLNFE
ncbi:MAG: hypothetical protein Q9219_001217 [cf. Caloplaca sp. 3 TL-2023]